MHVKLFLRGCALCAPEEEDNAMSVPNSLTYFVLGILRIVTGLGFLAHGTSKFFQVPPFPMPLTPLLQIAGALELVGGALIIIGFLTRPVAFILSGMMAVAYFIAHFPEGFYPSANGGEAAMLYCFIFLYLAVAGAGGLSVDGARARRNVVVREETDPAL